MYVYIYTQKQKTEKKEGQHTNIVIVIIVVIAKSHLGVHNTPYKHNKETKTTSKRNKSKCDRRQYKEYNICNK
jgi:hypothetical protein